MSFKKPEALQPKLSNQSPPTKALQPKLSKLLNQNQTSNLQELKKRKPVAFL